MEALLPAADAYETSWRRDHPGQQLRAFEEPDAALCVLGDCLEQAKSTATPAALQRLVEAEELTVDRLVSLVQWLAAPEARQLATELVPRQAQRRRDNQPLTLFDVARAYTRRVPMSKSLALEPDVRLYLACVLIDAMSRAGEALVVPTSLKLKQVGEAEWERHRVETAGQQYEALGLIGTHLAPPAGDRMSEITHELRALREAVLDQQLEDMTTGYAGERRQSATLVPAARQLALTLERAVWSSRVSSLCATVVCLSTPKQPLSALPLVGVKPMSTIDEPQPQL